MICICCGKATDGTYGKKGPPVCFECYSGDRLRTLFDKMLLGLEEGAELPYGLTKEQIIRPTD